jgi:hypothetical protein
MRQYSPRNLERRSTADTPRHEEATDCRSCVAYDPERAEVCGRKGPLLRGSFAAVPRERSRFLRQEFNGLIRHFEASYTMCHTAAAIGCRN